MVSVSIDSGPVEATDSPSYVPQDKWRELMVARRMFLRVKVSYDCRCLVQFVADAEAMHGPLGFTNAEDMIRRGYELEPEEIRIAVDWLKLNPPDEPMPYARVLELGRHGGDRKSEAAKDQVGNAKLISEGGTTAAYTLARLDRDGFDELAAKVRSKELSANAAARAAGFRKHLTALDRIVKLLPKLTDDELEQLREYLERRRSEAA